MILNRQYWEECYQKKLIKQISKFYEVIQNRIIPMFDNIEEEAQKVQDDEWGRICSSPGDPDKDLGDYADDARDVGIEYYIILSGIKQAFYNISAASLYHLFEQQLSFFLRHEFLPPSVRVQGGLVDDKKLKKDIFSSYPKINELRLVANVVKHAEGGSAEELRKIRPDLFSDPDRRELIPSDSDFQTKSLFLPLAGEDFYIRMSDINEYKDSLIHFWEEFGKEITKG